MGDLHNRIAALSPEKLELFARRLAQRYGRAVGSPPEPEPDIATSSSRPELSQDGDPAELLARVGALPDEHVDVLLRQMLGVPESPSVQNASTEELLENLSQYSDDDVDALITELLGARNEPNP